MTLLLSGLQEDLFVLICTLSVLPAGPNELHDNAS
mgnify:CR=1 FL=1